jgi:hypothetical protein
MKWFKRTAQGFSPGLSRQRNRPERATEWLFSAFAGPVRIDLDIVDRRARERYTPRIRAHPFCRRTQG